MGAAVAAAGVLLLLACRCALPLWVLPLLLRSCQTACAAASCPPVPSVFDVQKHYWGATIIARGFRALYMVGRCQGLHCTGRVHAGMGPALVRVRSLSGGKEALRSASSGRPSSCPPVVQDSDAIVLQDPLPFFRPNYDVQSISDWSGDVPELPRVGDTLAASCQLYKWIPDPRTPTGGWAGRAAEQVCFSLAFWPDGVQFRSTDSH